MLDLFSINCVIKKTGTILNHHKIENLIFRKGPELFVFVYEPGSESSIIDTLVSYAKSENISLDWNDAAAVSNKITDRLLDKTEDLFKRLKQ
jgi:hypothetical protein